VSTKESLEVAELVVLEHETDGIVGEADSDQSRDVGVIQTRHDTRLALKVLSVSRDTLHTRDRNTLNKYVGPPRAEMYAGRVACCP